MLNNNNRDVNLIDILYRLIFKVLFRNKGYGRTIIKGEKERGRGGDCNGVYFSFHKEFRLEKLKSCPNFLTLIAILSPRYLFALDIFSPIPVLANQMMGVSVNGCRL
jgi:hypothetical protein